MFHGISLRRVEIIKKIRYAHAANKDTESFAVSIVDKKIRFDRGGSDSSNVYCGMSD